jgi:hypothetical protein
MPLAILKNVIGKTGCTYRLIGPSRRIDGHLTAVAYIPVSEEILGRIRSEVGHERPVIVPAAGLFDPAFQQHINCSDLPVRTGTIQVKPSSPHLEEIMAEKVGPFSMPLAALAYDGNGNLTSDGHYTYAYDAENRLLGATPGRQHR